MDTGEKIVRIAIFILAIWIIAFIVRFYSERPDLCGIIVIYSLFGIALVWIVNIFKRKDKTK